MKYYYILILFAFTSTNTFAQRVFRFKERDSTSLTYLRPENGAISHVSATNLFLFNPYYLEVVCDEGTLTRSHLLRTGSAGLLIWKDADHTEKAMVVKAQLHGYGYWSKNKRNPSIEPSNQTTPISTKPPEPIPPTPEPDFAVRELIKKIRRNDSIHYNNIIDSLKRKMSSDLIENEHTIARIKGDYNKITTMTGTQQFWLVLLLPTFLGLIALFLSVTNKNKT